MGNNWANSMINKYCILHSLPILLFNFLISVCDNIINGNQAFIQERAIRLKRINWDMFAFRSAKTAESPIE